MIGRLLNAWGSTVSMHSEVKRGRRMASCDSLGSHFSGKPRLPDWVSRVYYSSRQVKHGQHHVAFDFILDQNNPSAPRMFQ